MKGKRGSVSGEEWTAVNLMSTKEVNIIANTFNYWKCSRGGALPLSCYSENCFRIFV